MENAFITAVLGILSAGAIYFGGMGRQKKNLADKDALYNSFVADTRIELDECETELNALRLALAELETEVAEGRGRLSNLGLLEEAYRQDRQALLDALLRVERLQRDNDDLLTKYTSAQQGYWEMKTDRDIAVAARDVWEKSFKAIEFFMRGKIGLQSDE